jgi:glycosyltransferase involved in cell wall biosynthesis
MAQSISPQIKVLLSAGMIQGGLSGVGRYVVELANRISDFDEIDLYVAGLDADRHLFTGVDPTHWITIPARYGSGFKNLLWHQWHLREILQQGGFDLFHAPSYRRIMAFCPVPQVATVHDCAPFHLRDKYGFLRGIFGRQVAPWMARRCRSVITVSHFTKQDLVNFYKLPESRITVIHNGLNHRLYRPRNEDALGAFRAAQQLAQPFFFFVSRLEHPGKNHIRLIEAFERFREQQSEPVQLILGGAAWHGAEMIEKRVANSPFAADIRLPGFIDEEDLPLWYASAKALVFPSLIEGFGLPVVEALACGLRVASSDRGSLPEVGGEAAVYFDPESVSSIFEAMELIHGEASTESAGRVRVGLEHAASFDWDLASKATCHAYLNTII